MIRLFKSKVRSFSMVEILVVMVLSSIVVSIIYLSYYTVFQYQQTLEKKYSTTDQLSTLYFQLKQDVDKAIAVKRIKGENVLWLDLTQETITYTFSDNYIVRLQGERSDTSFLQTNDFSLFWKNEELKPEDVFVDRVDVHVLNTPTPTKLTISKNYDISSLIELDTVNARHERD